MNEEVTPTMLLNDKGDLVVLAKGQWSESQLVISADAIDYWQGLSKALRASLNGGSR